MSDVLLPTQNLPPVCLTLDQLKAVLGPIVIGYKWGEDTIHDLWKLGAPVPPLPGRPQTGERLIVPSQLMAWLEDVLTRQGRPLSESAKLYAHMMKTERG